MKNEIHYKKGMILISQWGYGQTNISWYKIVKVSKSGKTLTLQEYDGKYKASKDNYMCGHSVINTRSKRGDTFRKTIKPYFSPAKYKGSFEVWDGTEQFESHWN